MEREDFLYIIDPLESKVLTIAPRMENDQVLAVYDLIRFYHTELGRLRKLAEELILAWIEENGDLRVRDGIRYVAADSRTTRCVDVRGAIEAILTRTGGNFETLCEMLVAQPIKPGACKTVLDEEWGKHFQVETKKALEEKPAPKKLVRIDDAFFRPKSGFQK